MTPYQKQKVISDACIAANPSIKESEYCECGHQMYYQGIEKGRPIRLADVLLAIGRRGDRWNIGGDGCFNHLDQFNNWQKVAQWNLKSDTLSAQSPETIDFLYELLK